MQWSINNMTNKQYHKIPYTRCDSLRDLRHTVDKLFHCNQQVILIKARLGSMLIPFSQPQCISPSVKIFSHIFLVAIFSVLGKKNWKTPVNLKSGTKQNNHSLFFAQPCCKFGWIWIQSSLMLEWGCFFFSSPMNGSNLSPWLLNRFLCYSGQRFFPRDTLYIAPPSLPHTMQMNIATPQGQFTLLWGIFWSDCCSLCSDNVPLQSAYTVWRRSGGCGAASLWRWHWLYII